MRGSRIAFLILVGKTVPAAMKQIGAVSSGLIFIALERMMREADGDGIGDEGCAATEQIGEVHASDQWMT